MDSAEADSEEAALAAGSAMKELWELFLVFCRIGAFTFGGGYAMLPMIQKEIVENRQWATEEEIVDYYAVGDCCKHRHLYRI